MYITQIGQHDANANSPFFPFYLAQHPLRLPALESTRLLPAPTQVLIAPSQPPSTASYPVDNPVKHNQQ